MLILSIVCFIVTFSPLYIRCIRNCR